MVNPYNVNANQQAFRTQPRQQAGPQSRRSRSVANLYDPNVKLYGVQKYSGTKIALLSGLLIISLIGLILLYTFKTTTSNFRTIFTYIILGLASISGIYLFATVYSYKKLYDDYWANYYHNLRNQYN